MNKREQLASMKAQQDRAARIELAIIRLEEELANRPEEPPVDAVISFERTYEKSGRRYNWVAYQAVEGYWYLSQSNYRGGFSRMTWDELLDFIDDNPIFICTGWEQLT